MAYSNFSLSNLSVGSIVMMAAPEFQSNHSAGRSVVVIGLPDPNGYVLVVPFSTEEDRNHPGLNLYPKGVGGRDADGFLMIGHQGYAHISRIYRHLGQYTEQWLDRVYDDLESCPLRIIPRVYHPLG